jgi:hypothetical protein
MKNLLIIALICAANFCYAQKNPVFIDKATFLKLKRYSVISTSTIDSAGVDGRAVLRFKILDQADQHVKNYDAFLQPGGYVGLSKQTNFPTSLRSFSVMTVPFKIRQRNDNGSVTAKADIKNVGLYLPFYLWDYKRYWIDNTVSSHKVSFGLVLAPMAEDLNDENTNDYFKTNDKKTYTAVMLSTGLAVTYTYKTITLGVIPVGFDFGLDNAGKNWVNSGKYWFGFGIGIDAKLFGF